jgi:hypothetical protein
MTNKRLSIVSFLTAVTIFCTTLSCTNQLRKPEAKLSSKVLFNAFSKIEEDANIALLNKYIEVDGKVATIGKQSDGSFYAVLESADVFNGVMCTFLHEPKKPISQGEYITIRGICKAFKGDVQMTDCIVLGQK